MLKCQCAITAKKHFCALQGKTHHTYLPCTAQNHLKQGNPNKH